VHGTTHEKYRIILSRRPAEGQDAVASLKKIVTELLLMSMYAQMDFRRCNQQGSGHPLPLCGFTPKYLGAATLNSSDLVLQMTM